LRFGFFNEWMDERWCQFTETGTREEVWGRAREDKWSLKYPPENSNRLQGKFWMKA